MARGATRCQTGPERGRRRIQLFSRLFSFPDLGCLGSSSGVLYLVRGFFLVVGMGVGMRGKVVFFSGSFIERNGNYVDEGGSRNNKKPKLVAHLKKKVEELVPKNLNRSPGRKKGSTLRESKIENDSIFSRKKNGMNMKFINGKLRWARGSLRYPEKTKYMHFLKTNA